MGLNRWTIGALVLLLSVAMPAALVGLLASVPASSLLDLVLLCASVTVWVILIVLINWWEFTGSWLRWLWVGTLIAALVARGLRARDLAVISNPDGLALACALATGAGILFLSSILAARRPHVKALDLAYPVGAGRFLVTDGGDGARSFFVNYHYGFGTHRKAGVGRSMRYATDIVEVGRSGTSCRGFLPRSNDAFKIWERPLFAPCSGRVVRAVNDVADNDAFGSNRPYGVGNHVVLQSGADIFVVVGHLRQGSVIVKPGQDVKMGEPIGQVGNSGWTERPHLHIQAMRNEDGDWWHGEPLPMRFGGRFLVRNQHFRI